MLRLKKDSKKTTKKPVEKLKIKDTLDEAEDLFGPRISKTKKDERNTAKTTKKSIGSKKVLGIDQNVQQFEGIVRRMLAHGGLVEYYDKRLNGFSSKSTTTAADANPEKNRKTVSCYDHSRVKLMVTDHGKSDYINASHINIENVNRKYILAQYPLPNAFEDFWSMIFDNDVETVLSVFNPLGDPDIKEFQEKPTPDSTAYFPLKKDQYVTIGRFFVHTRKVEVPEKSLRPFIYTIEVLPEGCSECKFVRIINYPKWEEKGKSHIKIVLSMIRAIEADPLQKGTVLFHCNNGLNRSALLLLTDVINKMFLDEKTWDIAHIVSQIRQQRCGAFTSSYYVTFAIYAVASYVYLRCKSRGTVNKETVQLMKTLLQDLEGQCPTPNSLSFI